MPLPPIAIVISRYNRAVTDRLLAGAIETYTRLGGERDDLTVIDAAGAFELPFLANAARESGRFAALVAIGCIIKGETSHDQVLGHAVTQSLLGLTTRTDESLPVGLALLTVDTPEQALARAGGPQGQKGAEAMLAVLQSLAALIGLTGGLNRRGGRTVFDTPELARVPSPSGTSHDKTDGGRR